MSGAGVFSSSYWPVCRPVSLRAARSPAISLSAVPPSLSPGTRQVRSRGEVLVVRCPLEWKRHEIFMCSKSAAVEKNVPSMGTFRGAPASSAKIYGYVL
jgi:hypothetical protein